MRRFWVLLACSLLAWFVVAPEREQAAPLELAAADTLLGAQSHATWSSATVDQQRRELDLLQRAGAKVVRTDFSWSSLESDGKGRYSQWLVDKLDSFTSLASARGIKVIATIWSTPCWASAAPESVKQGCVGAWWDRGVDRYAPANPADYADAVRWFVRRYRPHLAAVEVWNEPNESNQNFLKAGDTVWEYHKLLRAAYPAVKAVAPEVPVIGPATSFSDTAWMAYLFDHYGDAPYLDGVSFHPYSESRGPYDASGGAKWSFEAGIQRVRDFLVARGHSAKRLWITEFGWSSCPRGTGWSCVGPHRQAAYVYDALKLVKRISYVRAAVVYNLREKGWTNTTENTFGLVRPDFTPKPAWFLFEEGLAP